MKDEPIIPVPARSKPHRRLGRNRPDIRPAIRRVLKQITVPNGDKQ